MQVPGANAASMLSVAVFIASWVGCSSSAIQEPVDDTAGDADVDADSDTDADTDTDTDNYSSTLVDESLQNTCAESALAPALTARGYSTYSWSTSGFTPEIEPEYQYFSSSGVKDLAAPGVDGIIRIELEYGESLWAGYQLTGGDAAIYLLEDCDDPTSGLAGDDYWNSDPEAIAYTYWGASKKVFSLVLDDNNFSMAPTSFMLQLQIGGELVDESLQNTCAKSASAPVVTTPGTHRYTWSAWGFTNNKNPSCASGAGVDGIIRVELEPGEALSVDRYQLVEEDASIYLLDDCGAATSCLAKSDQSSSTPESLLYTHWGNNTRVFTLVLDDWSSSSTPRSFELELSIY
jgi:hypothetical protein